MNDFRQDKPKFGFLVRSGAGFIAVVAILALMSLILALIFEGFHYMVLPGSMACLLALYLFGSIGFRGKLPRYLQWLENR